MRFIILFIVLFISCTPVKQSLRYKYYNSDNSINNSKQPIASIKPTTPTAEKPVISKKSIPYISSESSKTNPRNFIEKWLGVPYQYGGTTMSGVDCSSFSQHFLKNVYGKMIKRTSSQQFQQGKFIKRSNLKMGDLVFFSQNRSISDVDHVGVYLKSNKFIHASTSRGVVISNLGEKYYQKRYVGARRLLPN